VNRVVALRGFCFRDTTPEFAHTLIMKGLGGAHEDVVAAVCGIETKLARHLREITDDVISLLLRRASGFLRGAFDVDTVFVGTGQEVGLDTALALRTRDRVGHDHGVEMTEMRKTVGVVDWCSDVESVHLLTVISHAKPQRRKESRKELFLEPGRLCVFAPLREKTSYGFLANSSPGLNRGFSGISEIIRPIANAISPSWIIPRKSHVSRISSEGW